MRRGFRRCRRRFIPAQAGNTTHSHRRRSSATVHPRAGGEHHADELRRDARYGSSPRRRGTPSHRRSVHRACRFIPAQAGNTAAIAAHRRPRLVHPRAGGEHDELYDYAENEDGSSPRRRGTPVIARPCLAAARFIPAQAGNTMSIEIPPNKFKVHPRAGGEHRQARQPANYNIGSSPRRRGTLAPCEQLVCWRRFIPAQAGNT